MAEKAKCYLEERLTKLEWKSHEIETALKEVQLTSIELAKSLQEINSCLQQIKFTTFGAVAILLVQQLGVGEALTLILTK